MIPPTCQVELPSDDQWIEKVQDLAMQKMHAYEGCTQCLLAAFMEVLKISEPMVLRSAAALFGGMTASLTCGIHTGGLMILGLLMGRENLAEGLDGLIPIVMPAQKLVGRLNVRLGSHSCKQLTGVDFTDLNQAINFYNSDGHRQCLERVGRGAKEIALFLQSLQENGELFRLCDLGGSRHAPQKHLTQE